MRFLSWIAEATMAFHAVERHRVEKLKKYPLGGLASYNHADVLAKFVSGDEAKRETRKVIDWLGDA